MGGGDVAFLQSRGALLQGIGTEALIDSIEKWLVALISFSDWVRLHVYFVGCRKGAVFENFKKKTFFSWRENIFVFEPYTLYQKH